MKFARVSVRWAVVLCLLLALQQPPTIHAQPKETFRMGRMFSQKATGEIKPKGSKKLMKKARKRNFRTHHAKPPLLDKTNVKPKTEDVSPTPPTPPSRQYFPKLEKLPKERKQHKGFPNHQHFDLKQHKQQALKQSVPQKQSKEKGRRLQKNKDRARGVGRGAEQGATKAGAATTTTEGGGFARGDVPMMDWSSWGDIWMPGYENSFTQSSGNGGQEESSNGNEENSVPGGEVLNNQANGQERWRNQFVQALITQPPVATPNPTHAATPQPTQVAASQRTPVPTPAYDASTRGACQLCSDGGTATMMTRTLIKSTITCQDIANALAMADASACPMEKQNIPVDVESYCGCPGKATPNSCTFCPSGKENIWHNISIPSLLDWTCEDVETYTSHVTNAQACSDMVMISDVCCGTWEGTNLV